MPLSVTVKDLLVFDLDDTLYKEIEFLKSAYSYISDALEYETGHSIYEEMLNLYYRKISVFDEIKIKYRISWTIEELVEKYRFHTPSIELQFDTKSFLRRLTFSGIKKGVVTDGRSRTQRNKLGALGLTEYFDVVVISGETGFEKPHLNNFKIIQDKFPGYHFWYIGDNVKKDFAAPNKLNWTTVCLVDNGQNIHPQNVNIPDEYLPAHYINSFNDLILPEDYL